MAKRFWIGLAGFLCMIHQASAGPALVGAAEAPPLPAWVKFCGQNPDECKADPAQPEILTLTPEIRSLLSSVNRTVNSTLRPITDREHWGIVDVWSYPTDGSGDCEDYQLLKRKLLIEAGLPRRALLMTVVADENGDGHAVLTVRTDHGDFILDNKMDEVVEWFETKYVFIKRESVATARVKWVFLAPEPTNTLVASASP